MDHDKERKVNVVHRCCSFACAGELLLYSAADVASWLLWLPLCADEVISGDCAQFLQCVAHISELCTVPISLLGLIAGP